MLSRIWWCLFLSCIRLSKRAEISADCNSIQFDFSFFPTILKFMFSKKAKFDEIFTVDLMLCSKCKIDGEDFVNFRGLLRKHDF